MYCRTCGSKVAENAEVCVKCGCKPLVGKAYCQNCGAKTLAQQEVCTQCGARLKSTMTMTQKKKTAENVAVKVIGTVLLVFGCILLVAFVINAALIGSEPSRIFDAGRCALVGAPCLIGGIALRKKAKRSQ